MRIGMMRFYDERFILTSRIFLNVSLNMYEKIIANCSLENATYTSVLNNFLHLNRRGDYLCVAYVNLPHFAWDILFRAIKFISRRSRERSFLT